MCAVFVGEKEITLDPKTDKHALLEKCVSNMRKAHEKSGLKQSAFIAVYAENVIIDVESEILLQVGLADFGYCGCSNSYPSYFGMVCKRDKKYFYFMFRRENERQVCLYPDLDAQRYCIHVVCRRHWQSRRSAALLVSS